ncbi:MAG TPA: alpha/beta hydrolase [Myxococcaceae bacterium]|jgi:acetyl esterase/lipase
MPSRLSFMLLAIAAAWRTLLNRWRGRKRHPSWSAAQESAVELLTRNGSVLCSLPPERARSRMDAVALPPRARGVKTEPVSIGGAPGRWFIPEGAPADAALIYAHGGSFVIGSVHGYAELLARLAAATRLRVLAFDYRLAPEHRFPAALEDTLAVAGASGIAPHRMLLAGDSAGGNLALAAALELTRRGLRPAGAILLSPWVDLTASRPSVERNARFDWGGRGYLLHWISQYLPAHVSPADPRASPLYADLTGLPPLQIHAGTAELLHDEVVELAGRARAAGVEVELHEWPAMVHGWTLLPGVFPAARETLRACAAFASRCLDGA